MQSAKNKYLIFMKMFASIIFFNKLKLKLVSKMSRKLLMNVEVTISKF
jgi:hypothetical protein